jgi:hypothetical protein
MPEATPLVVAICNTHQAMCNVLSLILEAEGWCPVVANLAALHDDADAICALLTQHHAHIVIFDIAPPYDQHWQVFLQVRARSPLPDAAYIPTTNKRYLEELVGRTPTMRSSANPSRWIASSRRCAMPPRRRPQRNRLARGCHTSISGISNGCRTSRGLPWS